jgi:prophage regulatory protein
MKPKLQLATTASPGACPPPLPARVEKFIRRREIMARTGLGRSTIYSRIAQGTFPAPIPLRSPHIVAWVESEIQAGVDEIFWPRTRIVMQLRHRSAAPSIHPADNGDGVVNEAPRKVIYEFEGAI